MAPARPCGTTSKRSRSSGFGVLLIVDDFAQLGRADGPEIWLNCGWLNATRPARGSAPARRLRSRPSSSDGYEDVNDAERLRHDPAMRWIVGGKAAQGCAASPSQMGRFETQWLAAPENLFAIADLSGQWIDLVHGRRPPRSIVLDMDSSVSERLERALRLHLLSSAVRVQPVR